MNYTVSDDWYESIDNNENIFFDEKIYLDYPDKIAIIVKRDGIINRYLVNIDISLNSFINRYIKINDKCSYQGYNISLREIKNMIGLNKPFILNL
jgi:hypothetical protein